MPNLVSLNPIIRSNPEDIKNYYTENNLEIPKNTFFQNYLNILEEPKTDTFAQPIEDTKSYYPKLPKKETVSNVVSKLSQKDYTLDPSKSMILKEISEMNTSDEDKEYLAKMAERESNFKPDVRNQFGFFGLYQFGKDALTDTGFTEEDFKDTKNQHNAALELANINEARLRPIVNAYVGKEKDGVKITRNGIRAAAHLLGAGTVKDWFLGTKNSPFAKKGFVDGNGTHITEYLKMFA